MIATKRQTPCWGRDDILVAIEVIVYLYNNSLMEKLLNCSFARFWVKNTRLVCVHL